MKLLYTDDLVLMAEMEELLVRFRNGNRAGRRTHSKLR